MYLVLFDEEIIQTFQIDGNISVKENDVIWSTGRITGIQTPFIIVDVEPTAITDEVLASDRKSEFVKDEVTVLKEENQQLKSDMEQLAIELTTLMSLQGGGGSV